MPVTIARQGVNTQLASLRERRLRRGSFHDRGRRLRVELVNNMPDSAVFATQRQFVRLLEIGAEAFDVTLGLTTLPSIARAPQLTREMAELYRPSTDIAALAPDAMIFTGSEPLAAELDAEPYWRDLVALFDFARARAFATLASCLAAHALVLHLDGIRRRPCVRKWSGLYVCEVVAAHPLTQGLSDGATPHSRWNGLDEQELAEKGYVVLTRSSEAGLDCFVKQDEHLTLFFQGHPEYDGDTLAREFRRDAVRAARNVARAPELPDHYYSPDLEARLRAHVAGVVAGTEAPNLPAEALVGTPPEWRKRGGVLIENWLMAIAERKAAAAGERSLRSRWGG